MNVKQFSPISVWMITAGRSATSASIPDGGTWLAAFASMDVDTDVDVDSDVDAGEDVDMEADVDMGLQMEVMSTEDDDLA